MKVLGLDLGTASIGWALIEIDDSNSISKILGLGSRIISYNNSKDESDFSAGRGESACSVRTSMRTARKLIDRYQLRRANLKSALIALSLMIPDETFPPLSPADLWKLRSDAATMGVRLSKSEIARVLLHLNQRRGYKHSKSDIGETKQSEYVERVNNRYAEIKDLGLTVGQYFYQKLRGSETQSKSGHSFYTYRIKEKVFPRAAYAEEFDRMMETQSEFYPDILTPDNIRMLKQTIFYQRPLKSCKHLVSFCEFERKIFKDAAGNLVDSGPKVAPRTSPLTQVCKLYESINNIRIVNPRLKKLTKDKQPSLFNELSDTAADIRKYQYEYKLTGEERQRIFEYINCHEKLSETELMKILGLKKSEGFKLDKAVAKGLQGNTTYCKISEALGAYEGKDALLKFDLTDTDYVIEETGEVITKISPEYIRQPLHQLWHTLYSISDKDELLKCLRNKFHIEDKSTLEKLYALDFVSPGYSNKSSKFICKILPYLRDGYQYSDACKMVGVNHSDSLTKQENDRRTLSPHIGLLKKGELRQPIVEKVLNQTVNLVNAIINKYGEITEARVELARELKQSREDRKDTADRINRQENVNKELAARISELGIQPSRRRIQKMRMLEETGNKCMYCGKVITPTQFIEGHGYEIEHIIPRSVMFDDSFSNKVCSCRECNREKGAMTAYDFMKSKTDQEFNSYCDRVEELYKKGSISKSKRNKLMMALSEIPQDFIERDLVESQYIAKKAREILRQSIRDVHASSGSVTSYLRHLWGYDMILHDLNLPKYKDAGITEKIEYEHKGQTHLTERIKDWSKRKDHRHHALDALVIALTRQSYIQRLSTINASGIKDTADYVSLDKWAVTQPHFSVADVANAVDSISVSFKAGKKLVSSGKRYIRKKGKRICAQSGILVPRGPLTKESVYGFIKVYDGKKNIKHAVNNPDLIIDDAVRKLIQKRLDQYNGDCTQTIKSFKKDPLELNGKEITEIGCHRIESVINYNIDSLKKESDIKSIVDPVIRKIVKDRFDEVGNKNFVKSLADKPLYSDNGSLIRTVRCFTGLKPDTLACVRFDQKGSPIGFSQTRNNHHLAFYKKPDGQITESVVSFWDCILRKRYGIPVIVNDPNTAWEQIANLEDNLDIQKLAASLPPVNSEMVMYMQRNEMFVLGMSDDEWNDAVKAKDLVTINRHLYRVWKLAAKQYCFKFHTDTKAAIQEGDKEMKQYYMLTSISALQALNPKKVKVSILGEIAL